MVGKTYLTVRYAETDMMGIVHHSRYYPWFEVARTEFIKNCGMKYSDMEKMGMLLPLTKTEASYHHGLRYEDEVLIECRVSKLTVARCEFLYKVYKLPEMKLCTEGKTAHGFTDENFRPINLKKKFPKIWEIMENAIEEEVL